MYQHKRINDWLLPNDRPYPQQWLLDYPLTLKGMGLLIVTSQRDIFGRFRDFLAEKGLLFWSTPAFTHDGDFYWYPEYEACHIKVEWGEDILPFVKQYYDKREFPSRELCELHVIELLLFIYENELRTNHV